jgi:cell division protein FtsZ
MFEVDEASRLIKELCDPDANIIFGTSIDERYTGEIKITVIATGFNEETNAQIASMSRGGFGQSRVFGQAPATMSKPLYQNQTAFGGQTTPVPEPQNDYEVPAFLRNKLNK